MNAREAAAAIDSSAGTEVEMPRKGELYKSGVKGIDRVWISRRKDGKYGPNWVEIREDGFGGRRYERLRVTTKKEMRAAADAKSRELRSAPRAVVIEPHGHPRRVRGETIHASPADLSLMTGQRPAYGTVGWACREYEEHRVTELPESERDYHRRVLEMFRRSMENDRLLATLDDQSLSRYAQARSSSAELPDHRLFPDLIGADLGPPAPRRRAVLADGTVVFVPPALLPAETLRLAAARAEYLVARRLGQAVPKPDLRGWRWPVPVGARTIERESKTIRSVLKFALQRAEDVWERPLRCRLAGIKIQRAEAVHRPAVEGDEVTRLLAAAPCVHADLADLIRVCAETGRRISAILALTSHDLSLDGAPPRFVWSRAKNQELQDEVSVIPVALVPLLAARVATLEAGDPDWRGPFALFPARGKGESLPPGRAQVAMASKYARGLLDEAFTLAGLTRPKRGGFHMFRRAFASDLLEMAEPDATTMSLGGWRDAKTMHNYQLVRPRVQAAALERLNRHRNGEESRER